MHKQLNMVWRGEVQSLNVFFLHMRVCDSDTELITLGTHNQKV